MHASSYSTSTDRRQPLRGRRGTDVAKEVGPKREKVAQLTAQLEAANKELQAKRDNLAAVVAKVEQLQKTCDETVAEKQRLLDAQAQTVRPPRLDS